MWKIWVNQIDPSPFLTRFKWHGFYPQPNWPNLYPTRPTCFAISIQYAPKIIKRKDSDQLYLSLSYKKDSHCPTEWGWEFKCLFLQQKISNQIYYYKLKVGNIIHDEDAYQWCLLFGSTFGNKINFASPSKITLEKPILMPLSIAKSLVIASANTELSLYVICVQIWGPLSYAHFDIQGTFYSW